MMVDSIATPNGSPLPDAAREVLEMAFLQGQHQDGDPAGNVVLATAHRIVEMLDHGKLSIQELGAAVNHLRDSAFMRRATRLHRYPGGTAPGDTTARLNAIAALLVPVDIADIGDEPALSAFRAATDRTRFAAVFTAHPTFAVANPVYAALADYASREIPEETAPVLATHRRSGPPTLEEEFTLVTAAIQRGRDAIDQFVGVLLKQARETWPAQWAQLAPHPIILTSWVGYDTDGRTDINWWDVLRLRLRMKLLQLQRLQAQLAESGLGASPLIARLQRAEDAVEAQIAACPVNAEPEASAEFAEVLVGRSADGILDAGMLADALQEAIDTAPEAARLPLAIARSGFLAHGMALAHTHTRLNATQIHNVIRQRLRLTDDPTNPAHRRALLAYINEALDVVTPVPVDFGALLTEQASAARLMMTVAQILKHIDSATPVRFLIAETESGYTLLAALWLARHFGIAEQIEISPLFETREALMGGAQIIEEALRSPHWRAYLRATGKLSLQFGYSDSGRYVGQLAATYLVERLRLKVTDLLARWDLSDIEVILFDTHGESIGRGAHPQRLAGRLDYLSPPHARAQFDAAGVRYREESAFQGGDGYLLFGTPELAGATIATIAEHVFEPLRDERDPVYDEPDFSADFFLTIGEGMTALVADPGYANLLGAFGPALIDKSGSRPSARQTEGGGSARITHPSQLRAIPNNAILQQLGWCANTIQGLGSAARRHPETFDTFHDSSARFHRALDFASHALAHSDDNVLRAMIWLLDPGYWLDRASAEANGARRDGCITVMHDLERLNFWAATQSMFRRIQEDHLGLRAAWPDAPRMSGQERLLHAIRIALVERIWLLAAQIPFFMPRGAFTRDVMMRRILCLEIPDVLRELDKVFPRGSAAPDLDFYEEPGPQVENAYQSEHEEIFLPIRDMFEILREISIAVAHSVGAFG